MDKDLEALVTGLKYHSSNIEEDTSLLKSWWNGKFNILKGMIDIRVLPRKFGVIIIGSLLDATSETKEVKLTKSTLDEDWEEVLSRYIVNESFRLGETRGMIKIGELEKRLKNFDLTCIVSTKSIFENKFYNCNASVYFSSELEKDEIIIRDKNSSSPIMWVVNKLVPSERLVFDNWWNFPKFSKNLEIYWVVE